MTRMIQLAPLSIAALLLAGPPAAADEILSAGGQSVRVKRIYRHYNNRTTTSPTNSRAQHPVHVHAFCDPGGRYDGFATDPVTQAACDGRMPLRAITIVDLSDRVHRVDANQVGALVQMFVDAHNDRQRARAERQQRRASEERSRAVARLQQKLGEHKYEDALRQLEAFHHTEQELAADLRPLLDRTLVGLANQAREEAKEGRSHNSVDLLIRGHKSELSKNRTRTLDAATAVILDQLLREGHLGRFHRILKTLEAANREGPWISIRLAEYACLVERWTDAVQIAEPLLEDREYAGRARRVMAEAQFNRGDVAEAIDRTAALDPADWVASPLPTQFLMRLFEPAARRVRTPEQAEALLQRIAALSERVPESGRVWLSQSVREIQAARGRAEAEGRFESKLRQANALAQHDPVGSLDLYDEALAATRSLGVAHHRTRVHRQALEAALAGLAAGGDGDARAASAVIEHVEALKREGELRTPGTTASRISDLVAKLPVGDLRLEVQEAAAILAIGTDREQAIGDSYVSELRAFLDTLEGDTERVQRWETTPSALREQPGMRALGHQAYAAAGWEALVSEPRIAIARFERAEALGALDPPDVLGQVLARRAASPGETAVWAGVVLALITACVFAARLLKRRGKRSDALSRHDALAAQGTEPTARIELLSQARDLGESSLNRLLQEASLRLETGSELPVELSDALVRKGQPLQSWLEVRHACGRGDVEAAQAALRGLAEGPPAVRLDGLRAVWRVHRSPDLALAASTTCLEVGRAAEAAQFLDEALGTCPSAAVADRRAVLAVSAGDAAALARAGRVLVNQRPDDHRLLSLLQQRLVAELGADETDRWLCHPELQTGEAVLAARQRAAQVAADREKIHQIPHLEERLRNGDVTVREPLIAAHRLAGAPDRALRALQTSLQGQQPEGDDLRTLGMLHLECGNNGTAAQILRRYLSTRSNTPDLNALYALGCALEEQAPDEALVVYRQIHEIDVDHADVEERIFELEETAKEGFAGLAGEPGGLPCGFCGTEVAASAKFCRACGVTQEERS